MGSFGADCLAPVLPAALNKANQDSYLIQPTGMGNMKGKGLFGVFDGHGPKGHLCSGFVKEKVRAPGSVGLSLRHLF